MNLPIRWNAEALWQAVEPGLPGFTIEVLPQVDSTSTELMRRARQGLVEPSLLVAELQTAGRGRLGRPWVGQPGESLMFSLGLLLAPRDWSGLSLAVGATVAEALQPGGGTGDGRRLGLKWPNDLWLEGDRKLGGILIETASLVGPAADAHPGARYVVIGIGLNVCPREAQGLSTPPACLQEVDPRWTAPSALACVIPPLVAAIQRFAATGFAPFQADFAARDLLQGRQVRLSNDLWGQARGVDTDGALLVETPDGLERITGSEVSVRPAAMPLP